MYFLMDNVLKTSSGHYFDDKYCGMLSYHCVVLFNLLTYDHYLKPIKYKTIIIEVLNEALQ